MTTHDLAAHVHHEDEEHNRAGERRTQWVVMLTAMMMVTELVIAHYTGSVALKADGWHMGTHVLALGLTLVAYWYARTRANTDTFSFGTGKIYALAGYTSGVFLAGVAFYMAYEGGYQLLHHEPVKYGESLIVACVGLVVNLVSVALLGHQHHYGHDHGHDHDHDHDHEHEHEHEHEHQESKTPEAGTLDFNLRAAYIHILADAMTSVLAIGALSAGKFAGIWYFDPLMGFIGGGVIVWWAVSLCKQAARQLLDVVSSPTCEGVVRKQLEAIDDVRVADLHVWDLGPGRRSCIVSLVTSTPREIDFYRTAVLRALPVAHLTIEVHGCALPHTEAAVGTHVAHHHEH
ncbi:MAG: CDF family Co(II)/Ni(II) efflux transporter DmeF [Deltaproteobacteria bacterium]